MLEKNKLYTVAELAEIMRCRKSTIYDWVHYGKIGCCKIGGLRFSVSHITDFIQANSKPPKRVSPRTPGTRRRSCRVPSDTIALIESAKNEVLQSRPGGSCAER